jgi:cell division protein FtsQ
MKKLSNILILVFAAAYITIISGFIGRGGSGQVIESTIITVRDSSDFQFITRDDILSILNRKNFTAKGRPASDIVLADVEGYILENRIVKKVEAYITEPGILHIDIWQKNPFLRVSNQSGQGYYIDREGNIIPLSEHFSPYVLVASGFIREPFNVNHTGNILIENYDSLATSKKIIYELFELAKFVSDDKFLSSQFEQIYVTSGHEFELVPRVGPHIIELGSTVNMKEKFENLMLFYEQGLPNTGWNLYEKISLKYKNQVVCTKIK